MNTEGYHLLINGEQKGPYALSHLLHLFSAGFITRETLYWHEGFEEWQQVGVLCDAFNRKQARLRWIKPLAWLVILAGLAAVVQVCIPILTIAWKEAYQNQYTTEAAYWRARQCVRERTRVQGELLKFVPFSPTTVQLKGNEAIVQLSTTPGSTPAGAWKVVMVFTPSTGNWKARAVDVLGVPK